MKRLMILAQALGLSLLLTSTLNLHATDGTWTLAAGGNQDWGNLGNWLNGVAADGVDAAAVFNVDLTSDQTITNVFGRTVGHMFFQDSNSSSSSQGGYGLGNSTEAALGVLTLHVSSGRSVIDVGTLYTSGGKKVSVSIPLANAEGILKINSGQVSIRANATNLVGDYVASYGLTDTRSYLFLTNLAILSGGQFQVDFGNAPINSTNLLVKAPPVVMGGSTLVPNPAIPPYLPLALTNPVSGGGTLTISGRHLSTNSQSFGGITFNRGSHTINVTTVGTNFILADPGTFTRNAGAVVNFNSPGTPTNILFAGGLVNDANGIIGGWAIDGANWATVSPTGAIAPLTNYETGLDPSTWTATTNVSLSGTALAALGNRTINTLRLSASCTNSIGSGNTLTLGDGALLASAGIAQVTDGTLLGLAGGELIIHVSGTNILSSVIADNGSASTLIKSGGGVLMLTGTNANTYSGGTFVNQGTLQIGDGAGGGNSLSLGTGPVTLLGSLQINRTNDLTITNPISGSGLLIKQGAGTLTLSGINTFNGFNQFAPGNTASGAGQSLGFAATRIDAGALAVATDTAVGGVLRFNNGGAIFRSADAGTRTIWNNVDVASAPSVFGTPSSGNLVFTGAMDTGNGSKTFTISNAVTTFNGPLKQGTAPGANTLTKNGPGLLVLALPTNPNTKPWIVSQGTVQISAPGCLGAPTAFNQGQLQLNGGALETTATMNFDDGMRGITLGGSGGTLNVDSGTTLTIGGANIVAGVGSLTKSGAGALYLTTASYTGSTFVNDGTLKLDPAASLSTSPSILVGAGATFDASGLAGGLTLAASQSLGGSGTVLGAVTGSGTSVITPGTAAPGTLTLNNGLTLQAGDTLVFDLTNNTTLGANDSLVVNGNLNLNNNVVSIRALAPGGVLANGTYRLVTYTGTKTGSLVVNAGTRFNLTIDDSTAGQINLVVVGQPASLAWRGNLSSSWDVGTTPNWLNGASSDVFFDFDTVRFDDTAASFNVSIDTTTVSPSGLTVNANSDYTFTGAGGLAGTTGLNKGGSGKLVLANFGPNTYTGPTFITNGTLQIGRNDGSGSIGTGPIQNDGTLRFQNGNAIAVTNLSGSGALYAEGFADLILAGSSTFSGSTVVSTNARLTLDPALGSTVNSLGSVPGVTVLFSGGLYLSVSGTYTQAVALSGSGYVSDTLGALRAGATLNWLGPVSLAADATIGADSGTLSLSNGITGAAFGLTKAGAGTLLLASNNVYGATTIASGTLQVGTGGTTGNLGTGPITNNAVLTVNRGDTIAIPNAISGTGGFVKAGAGTAILSGNNSYDGTTGGLGSGAAGVYATRVDAGTLAIGSDYALGAGVFRPNAGGVILRCADANTRTVTNTLDIATDFVIGSADSGNLVWSGPLNSGNGAKTLTISNKVTTFSGPLAGGPSGNNVTKAGPGTLILSADNPYSRPTAVTGGLLLVNGSIGYSNVTVSGGALGGSGVILGPVAIQGGGTLAPGANGIGTLSISNTLTLAGTNLVEISKQAGASDLVQGLTSVTYGGRLVVTNLAGNLAVSDSFKLFDAQSYSGAFAAIDPASPGSGLSWDTNSLTVDGTLKIAVGPITVPTTPTNIVFGVVGSNLVLQWPTNYTGWRLLEQTNSLVTGVSTNSLDWDTVAGSSATNQVYIPISPSKPTEFYKLVYP